MLKKVTYGVLLLVILYMLMIEGKSSDNDTFKLQDTELETAWIESDTVIFPEDCT